MFFNLMELWAIVIASSAAPLWPLFKALCQKPPVKTIFASFKKKARRPRAEDVESAEYSGTAISQIGIDHGYT